MVWKILICAVLLAVVAPAYGDFWCNGTPDDVWCEVDGATVLIHHDHAEYNCCPDPFTHEIVWQEGLILVREYEHLTMPCFCLCCYDLIAHVENVPPGEWTVRFTWDDASTGGPLTEDLPVTVGDVGQEAPAVVQTTDSGCLGLTSVPEPEWTIESWSAIKTRYR